ncbi:hypothetical protein BRD17_07360 [Halobacteriales archaeon SW_7_68_16]|nr:MAG: hypothetical protein BRD17_07360 [Halobacteriales archaeon SW_7_68_16]
MVVDADVLAADLLVDGVERTVGDRLRSHSWLDLVASDALLGRAEAVIAAVVDADLATAWHDRIDDERIAVDHPPGDHPGLASAYRGNAAHLVTGEESLRSVETGATVRRYVDLSIRSPDAFRRSFDPSRLYPMVVGGTYPGPDRDPRA